jgi:NADPH:quinone reductase-like Zn-dependent oxidoreductase
MSFMIIASAAGYVYKVGSGVTRFKKGDRVLTNTAFMERNSAKYGTLQQYSLSAQHLTSHVSDFGYHFSSFPVPFNSPLKFV